MDFDNFPLDDDLEQATNEVESELEQLRATNAATPAGCAECVRLGSRLMGITLEAIARDVERGVITKGTGVKLSIMLGKFGVGLTEAHVKARDEATTRPPTAVLQ